MQYILDGIVPVPCDDLMTWGLWMQDADRQVAVTDIEQYRVSTVFLGLDHSFGDGEPILFETMIFGRGNFDGNQRRYHTWAEAEQGHAATVEAITAAYGRSQKIG